MQRKQPSQSGSALRTRWRTHEAIAVSSGPGKPRAALLSAGGVQDSTMVVKRCR
ncbi:hypothetical protein [Streptomyces sp. MS1.AVA.4]|uniref:Uncharacterized protein n=1 Tax=Streptomyces pratisoli TaxID=3139917 RepID=A0ACC6Q9L3_9ACTN